jgi:hypothetical protein
MRGRWVEGIDSGTGINWTRCIKMGHDVNYCRGCAGCVLEKEKAGERVAKKKLQLLAGMTSTSHPFPLSTTATCLNF